MKLLPKRKNRYLLTALLLIGLGLSTGCQSTTNPNYVFNPQASYLIEGGKGKIELSAKTGTNEFVYYGFVDVDKLTGLSIGYVDWEEE